MIHETADVQSEKIGQGTSVWQYSIVLKEASIGFNCNICSHVFIENEVSIGNNVTIKNGVYIWDGITLEDNVFIGPNVTFTNDKKPRSKRYQETVAQTTIKEGASVGAAAVLIGPLSIGRFAMIGAGAVVTKDVPDHTLVIGNPAVPVGKVNGDGEITELF